MQAWGVWRGASTALPRDRSRGQTQTWSPSLASAASGQIPRGFSHDRSNRAQEVPPFNHKEGSGRAQAQDALEQADVPEDIPAHLAAHPPGTHPSGTHTYIGTQPPGTHPPRYTASRYTFTRYTPRQHTHPDNTHTQVHTLAIHPGNTPRECIHLGNTHVYAYTHEFCTTYTKIH